MPGLTSSVAQGLLTDLAFTVLEFFKPKGVCLSFTEEIRRIFLKSDSFQIDNNTKVSNTVTSLFRQVGGGGQTPSMTIQTTKLLVFHTQM